MRKNIYLFFISMIVMICIVFPFERQEKGQKPEKHEVEVRLVLVDVVATKDGKFVTDLTKDDFEIYEDGKQVPINSFELISFEEKKLVTLKKAPEKPSPGAARKQLVVLFDGACSWQRNIKKGSRKIVDQLVDLANLGNEIMIMQMTEKKGLEILQHFTTDEKLIRKALLMASANIWLDKSEDALKMWQEAGAELDEELGIIERFEERLQPTLEEEYLWIQRGRFEKAVGGLLTVANMIKDLPGRKSILLISDGLPDLSSKTLNTKITESTGEAASKARTPGLDIRRDVGTIRVFDPFNILEKKKIMSGEEIIRELIRFANAQNISIYALDPDTFTKYFINTTAEFGPRERMLALSFRGEEKIKRIQNLTWLAEDTGAVSLKGAKKYERFYDVLSIDLNYYYQLSYYPRRKEADDEYHKIKVKVKRSGVDVRSRKGYTDYSENEREKILLVSAFYSPALFKQLPFKGDFVLFHKKSQKYEPWMNVALPVKELFIDRPLEFGTKKFNFHFWIKDKKRGDRAFGGQMTIPLKIDSSFIDVIKTTDYLCFHYKGPEMDFKKREYEVVFALYDEQTEEIGTWESALSLRKFKDKKQGAVINCLLGLLAPNPKKGKTSFSISKGDGSLEYGQLKFFPSVTNRFMRMENGSVFLQIFLPEGKIKVLPRFIVSGKGKTSQRIPGELVADSWNKKTHVWGGIFNIHLMGVMPGEYTLKVEIPVSEEEGALVKEVSLTKLRY